MPKLKGRYINLEESNERRNQIETQLIFFDKTKNYSRFDAIKGNSKEAIKRQIGTGELGLWKSWIKLLHEEKSSNECYDYLHIIEDDCILTKQLYQACDKLDKIQEKYDLLATDMYVNPSIYQYLKTSEKTTQEGKQLLILRGLYTGCTSSIVIPQKKINVILKQLQDEYNAAKKLIPLDNFLVRLQQQNKIDISITLPFVTSIMHESIHNSTIQNLEKIDEKITKTQEICYLLRSKLSVLQNENYCQELSKTAIELINLSINNQAERNNIITDTVIKILEEKQLMTYKHRTNLIGEPLNPQKQ